MPAPHARYARYALPLAAAALLALVACTDDPAPTATPTDDAPAATTAPSDPAGTPDATAAMSGDDAATDPDAVDRSVGEVDGIAFVVSEGSEATFSVGEVLARVTIPNYEAVMRTTGLSGEVRLDGGPSLVTIDLHSMTSDEPFRDRYVRSRMFPDQPTASVTFPDLTPLPDGFTDGDPVTTELTGTLAINDLAVPLTFAVEARDDGEVVYVVGRSTFTWDDIGEPVPTAQAVVSVEDEVRVEVLLALRPRAG